MTSKNYNAVKGNIEDQKRLQNKIKKIKKIDI